MEKQNRKKQFFLAFLVIILFLNIFNISYRQRHDHSIVETYHKNISLKPPSRIKFIETFKRRKFIYQRSCSLVKKLITLNKKGFTNENVKKLGNFKGHRKLFNPIKKATIEELKVFHHLLHDSTISNNLIVEKLEFYKESKLKLSPDKETLDFNI